MSEFPNNEARDPAIGKMLREHLDPGGRDEFLARMRAAACAELDEGRREQQHWIRGRDDHGVWETLAAWARPGLAAAAALLMALSLGLAFRPDKGGTVSVAEAVRPAGLPVGVIEDPTVPARELPLVDLAEAQ